MQQHSVSEDKGLAEDVAKVIEYYMEYGDLLLCLPKYKDRKLFVAVARDLTITSYQTSRMNVMRVLSNYDKIVQVLDMRIELIKRICAWNVTGINLNEINKFPTEYLDDIQRENNWLSRHFLNLATQHLRSISQDEWGGVLADVKSDFSFELVKIYHPVKLPFCINAFKELMIEYAKGESNIKMPEKNVNDMIEICDNLGESPNAIFRSIRDVCIANPKITTDKLKYFGNWLIRYGELGEVADSLEKIFQSQYLDDVGVVQILINNLDETKRIIAASKISDDYRNKMAALLETKYKTNVEFRNLCAEFGIK